MTARRRVGPPSARTCPRRFRCHEIALPHAPPETSRRRSAPSHLLPPPPLVCAFLRDGGEKQREEEEEEVAGVAEGEEDAACGGPWGRGGDGNGPREKGEEEACTCGRATAFVGKEGPTSALQLAAQRTRTCFDDAIGQPQISLDLHEQ